jgi:hypothetical protein
VSRGLAGLLAVFVALGALYSALVPLGEGPDEPGHMAYTFFLAREGRLPVQRPAPQPSDVPGEGHQPPLAYALAAPLLLWLPPQERALDQPGNPRFTWAGGAELNAVAHGSREEPPWRGAVLGWHMARLVSLALGCVTVLATYQTARALQAARRPADDERTLTTEHRRALLAAGLVALNPQFLFISALVTNDALLVALSALLLWACVRRRTNDQRPTTNDEGPTTKGQGRSAILNAQCSMLNSVVLGALLGLALLTKQSALLLAPVALLAVFPAEARGWRARGRVWLVRALLLLGAAALLSGWWFARNWRLYGDPLGLAAFRAEFATLAFDPRSPAAWLDALAQLHGSFWARFGWMNVAPPAWVERCYLALELLALAGWLRRAYRRRRTNDQRPTTNDQRPGERWSARALGPQATPGSQGSILNAQCFIPVLLLLALGWVVSFALTAGLVAWQGRLLFPALPAVAVLLAGGLAAWTDDQRATTNDQRHLTKDEGRRTKPGRPTTTDQRPPTDDRQPTTAGEGRRTKGEGQIQAHDALRFTFYVLRFTFYVLRFTFYVLPLALALWLPFGVIGPAYPRQTLPEARALAGLGQPAYGRFGKPGDPGAELRGWRVEGQARPGARLTVTLIWHARGRQNRDWSVFLHLTDQRREILAETNGPPRAGAFPMTQWVAGDWVEDRHTLDLPPDLAPGSYTLRVGLWDQRGTGERAARFTEKGKLAGDALDLGVITVVGAEGGG